jgi:arabinoxylan arabinofuranohydrolase
MLLLPFCLLAAALAVNPLVANVGMADPHIHYWPEQNAFYAYATHDHSPQNKNFYMTDWWVWSSPDLVTWTLAEVLYPNATPSPPDAWGSCWATDGAHRKNPATGSWEYFFYLSIGTCQVAVMKSVTSPAGPWENVLGTPLLNTSLGQSLNPKACFRDPALFQDEDGASYIISGVFQYYITRMNADLVSLAEEPRLVEVLNPQGPYGKSTDDKPFIHKANGLYYLSWGCFYGISDSVYGPYNFTGVAIDTQFIAPDFRMNVTSPNWYAWEDLADRHGSFWTAGGQWFYASNDRSHSTDTAHRDVFRDTVVRAWRTRARGAPPRGPSSPLY